MPSISAGCRRGLGIVCLLSWLGAGWAAWSAQTPRHRTTILSGEAGVHHRISPGGRFLATWSRDPSRKSTIVLWDTETGVRRFEIKSGAGQVLVSPDESCLVFDGPNLNDDFVEAWDITAAEKLATLRDRPDFRCMSFSPDSKLLVTKSWRTLKLKLWDLTSGKEIAAYQDLGFEVPIWASIDWRTGKKREVVLPCSPLGEAAYVWAIRGQTLAIGNDAGQIYIGDLTTGKQLAFYKLGSDIAQMAFSPDGKVLAVSFNEGAPARDMIRDILSPLGLHWADWLPPGGRTALLDVETGNRFASLPWTLTMAFRPDGRTLALYNEDKEALELWEVPSHPRLRVMQRWFPLAVAMLLTLVWARSRLRKRKPVLAERR